jgi:S-adenosylmethionine-diacylglycerol 3-amino-3-carboxypropyl transferase
MKKYKKDQVELFDLIYTLNWEDPQSDISAFKINKGDTIISVTSGGCNTIGYLLHDPDKVYSVDINPCQANVIELKLAAIRYLDYIQFMEFVGLRTCEDRVRIYKSLRKYLSDNGLKFWDNKTKILRDGLICKGKYSRYVTLVSDFVNIVYGKKTIDSILAMQDIEAQRDFFDKKFDNNKTRLLFKLFFNRYLLARKGLKADYFYFDDGSESFAESFFKKFRNVICNIPIRGNYFLQLYLKGKFVFNDELPEYMLEKQFNIIKNRTERVIIETDDVKKWMSKMPDNSIDCFGLSNICELMSLNDTEKLFLEAFRIARPKARLSLRNLMIPRDVPENMKDKIVIDQELSNYLKNNDRSFVYSKVAGYNILK